MDIETKLKKDEEVLAEIYRNCQLALQSISNILPETDDEEMKQELQREHEGYEKISAKACMIAKDKNIELKEPNQFKKMMMWGSIKMNTLTDGSTAHIADMMIQGTVMGITALKTTASEAECRDQEICALFKELLALEEGYEKKLKSFL
ncbi:MAG: hypothetical protein IJW58_01315 [Clostridia bacterium]|nr:hypothetical protein [Clostridia bacterium]